jgi:ATP-dependent Lon protease
MEVIELYSYTHEEKFNIAKKHLIPKQIKQHGLKANNLRISDDALRQIIDGYTREAGVRKLERKIAAISRVAAVGVAQEDFQRMTVTPANLETILGPAKFKPEDDYKDEVGAVNGLAWTSVGGEMLKIEVAIVPGKGKVELTGSLGGVMKESAKAAVTYIRSRAGELLIDEEFYKTKDIHIHVPQGAVPKDGPSAGAAIATALASALTGTPVHGKVAMTGEISLRGKVLPIGGLKEKTMAAYRAGMTKVLVPKDNEADLFEVDDIVKSSVEFVIAEKLEDVFDTAFIKTKMNSVVLKEVTQKKSVGLNYEI